MTPCRLQSNYSSTVTLHGGPVVLRPVRATRRYYMCVCVFVLQQALTRVIGKSSTGVFHFLAFYQSALVRARELIYFVYTGWAKKSDTSRTM